MTILNILSYPDPRLHTLATSVKNVTTEHKKLIKDIGSKTTIIYTNLDNNSDSTKHINFKKFIKNNIKFICSPYPPIEPFKKDIDNYLNQKYQLPFHHFPFNDYLKIKSVLGCRPYTGMSAILDILRYKIKSLYVHSVIIPCRS